MLAGSVSWMRFALLGKFYDANNKLLQAGVDLPFGLGTYGWKAYNVSYQVPPGADHYCVAALGVFPLRIGHGLGAEPADQLGGSCQPMVQEGISASHNLCKPLEHRRDNGRCDAAYASAGNGDNRQQLDNERTQR